MTDITSSVPSVPPVPPPPAAPPSSGAGLYFDGRTSTRHEVTVTLGDGTMRIAGGDGAVLAEWGYNEIEAMAAPEKVLRIGRRHHNHHDLAAPLERLEILDSAFAAEIDRRAEYIDRTGALARHHRNAVVLWTVAATACLVLAAYFAIPALAGRLAPLIPFPIERRLGDTVNVQILATLDKNHSGEAFECGHKLGEVPGRQALDKIMQRLQDAAALGFPLRTIVVRRKEANAITLPGGLIYIFQGAIDKASTPDELAGVISHEMGHAAHHDGTKAVLQSGGLSFLFGMLLGDFVGGGAVVISAKTIMQLTYSREVEAAADAYGAVLMNKAGGDAHGLATFLAKIGGATEPGMTILLDHPLTNARVAAVNKLAAPQDLRPFLTNQEWTALKRMCSG